MNITDFIILEKKYDSDARWKNNAEVFAWNLVTNVFFLCMLPFILSLMTNQEYVFWGFVFLFSIIESYYERRFTFKGVFTNVVLNFILCATVAYTLVNVGLPVACLVLMLMTIIETYLEVR